MKNNQKDFISLVLVGVIVVLVAIGGYFTWSKKFSETAQNTNSATTSPEVKNPEAEIPTSTTTTKNETTGWKTYTNTEHRFEVKYPPNWSERTISQTFVSPRQESFAIQNSGNNKDWVEIIVTLDSQPDFFAPSSNKLFGGLSAKIFRSLSPGSDIAVSQEGTKIGIWVEKNNKIYTFISHNTSKIEGIDDQILSTFKFTK